MSYMKVVYLTTKMIEIKLYTICSLHQLGLEVERPERSTTFSFFALFYMIKEIVFRQFFQPPYTEPVALFMKFPTRVSRAKPKNAKKITHIKRRQLK